MAGGTSGLEHGRMQVRVLVVDDHEQFRRVARRILSGSDFRVVGEAANGAQALERADELHPDVVLLDVQLPDSDGFCIAEALCRRPAPPAVVLVSTRARSDYGGLVEGSPARGFLAKAELTGDALCEVLGRTPP
jgi:DNA-binding NarL/FixJ family response regulator